MLIVVFGDVDGIWAIGCRKDKTPLVFLSGKIVQKPVKMYTLFLFRVCHSALRAENSNFVVKEETV